MGTFIEDFKEGLIAINRRMSDGHKINRQLSNSQLFTVHHPGPPSNEKSNVGLQITQISLIKTLTVH